jgi:microcystin degradation protein MlrC
MDYEPISKAVMSVDSPGCCRADLTQLPFQRIPRPMFPFDIINDVMLSRTGSLK